MKILRRGFTVIGLMVLLGGVLSCDNFNNCSQALDILEGCGVQEENIINGTQMGFLESQISGGCDGFAQCVSECIIDNPEGACEFQNNKDNPPEEAEGDDSHHGEKSPELKNFEFCYFACFVGELPI
jgi:hypothetical protein